MNRYMMFLIARRVGAGILTLLIVSAVVFLSPVCCRVMRRR